jgi:hypothetical protein
MFYSNLLYLPVQDGTYLIKQLKQKTMGYRAQPSTARQTYINRSKPKISRKTIQYTTYFRFNTSKTG